MFQYYSLTKAGFGKTAKKWQSYTYWFPTVLQRVCNSLIFHLKLYNSFHSPHFESKLHKNVLKDFISVLNLTLQRLT